VHDYAALIRASIASAGNDHRLGANEAPPAIISIFIGKYLTDILNQVEQRVSGNFDEQDEAILKLDIHKSIPELMLDNTDRNRTSPFAFTGNKFEFRAVGSSANCAVPMTTLNTVMAETLKTFKTDVDGLIEKGEKKEVAILHTIRRYIVECKKVLFEGDGYSDEWEKEAEKRGLENVKTTPTALDAFVSEKTMKLFESNNIYSHPELEARHEIMLEEYIKKVQIEARVMGDLASTVIVPSAIKYQNILLQNINGLKDAGVAKTAYANQLQIVEKISEHIQVISDKTEAMIEARKKANEIADTRARAIAYCDDVKGNHFDVIRYNADKLELMVDDSVWLLPKYREILFLR
jgi:glutamine synthetase